MRPRDPAISPSDAIGPMTATAPATVGSPKPLIVGFWGADIIGWTQNLGNQELTTIGQQIQGDGFADQKTFNSLDWWGAYRYILGTLDTNDDGHYDPNAGGHGKNFKDRPPDVRRSLRIYGHSWGGLSAVILAQDIQKDRYFHEKTIDVLATIDPVKIARSDYGGVPSNVKKFWNRFASTGGHIGFPILATRIEPHGYDMPSLPGRNVTNDDPMNHLDLTGATTWNWNYPEEYPLWQGPWQIDHWTIIGKVRMELIALLEGP